LCARCGFRRRCFFVVVVVVVVVRVLGMGLVSRGCEGYGRGNVWSRRGVKDMIRN
jgi:hypothetical protein